MPTVVTETGTLTDAAFWGTWDRQGGFNVGSSQRWMDYAAIYRTQPNVRTMVDFIARNIAQLGLHMFRRVGDTDRVRVTDHDLARMLARPNFRTTRHRFFHSSMTDMGIYWNSYALKIPGAGKTKMALLRVPPHTVTPEGGLLPRNYKVALSPTVPMDVKPEQILHFRLHNPENPLMGLAPLETLRRILDEDTAAVENRGNYWQHAGRKSVVITRPKDAGTWGEEKADRFNRSFTQAWKAPQGDLTPVLEDGMQLVDMSFSAEQSQYAEGRRLTREEVATAYHVPLSMAGIPGAPATFASVKEFRKMLYADVLAPWLDMLEEDLELQLFDDFANVDDCYVEFNLAGKLEGSFEEQVDLLVKAAGRPIISADEARAKLNYPAFGGDAGELAVPLNIDPTGQGVAGGQGAADQSVTAITTRTMARQRSAIEKRLAMGFGSVIDAWDGDRWDRELAADLASAGVTLPLLAARSINAKSRAQLESALGGRTNGHAH